MITWLDGFAPYQPVAVVCFDCATHAVRRYEFIPDEHKRLNAVMTHEAQAKVGVSFDDIRWFLSHPIAATEG